MAAKYHGKRALLNLPGRHSTGAIVAEIEDTRGWKKGKDAEGKDLTRWGAQPFILLQVANCDRSMSFDIDITDPQGSLYKIDTFIEALTAFRDGFLVEVERHETRMAGLRSNDEED